MILIRIERLGLQGMAPSKIGPIRIKVVRCVRKLGMWC